ncbi:hypothetical protein CMI47_04805 [Candidatus Pacearchaeota archaeon]|nr:hypothetical protein [Candidatus Pacearchaeota archaeon]
MVIFLHIQKTAGSSVNKILEKQKKYKYWYKYRSDNSTPDMISGHIPYGIHKEFGVKKFSYFTFLREPIDRWISMFYFGISNPKSWKSSLFDKCGQDLKKYLLWCLENELGCNIMVKQLSGLEDKKNVKKMVKGVSNEDYPIDKDFGYYNMFGYTGRKERSSESHLQDMFAAAKHNISKNIDFVGYQSNGFADQVRLCKHYGFPALKKEVFVRKAKKRLTEEHDWDDPGNIALLREINKYDIKFFRFVKKRNLK